MKVAAHVAIFSSMSTAFPSHLRLIEIPNTSPRAKEKSTSKKIMFQGQGMHFCSMQPYQELSIETRVSSLDLKKKINAEVVTRGNEMLASRSSREDFTLGSNYF